MRPTAVLGDLALAVAIGCLVVGFGFVVPALERGNELVDANLAKALAQGVASLLGVILVVACVFVLGAAPRWIERRAATTLALGAAVLAGFDRVVIMPRVHQAWSRVDLVAGRPQDRLNDALALTQWHEWLLTAVGLALVALMVLARWPPRRTLAPGRPMATDPGGDRAGIPAAAA